MLKHEGMYVFVMNDNSRNNYVYGSHGAVISSGDNATNTVVNHNSPNLEELTKSLIEQINSVQADDIRKKELIEFVEATSAEIDSPKPRKVVFNSLLDTTNKLIDTFTKTPALVEAFGKWSEYISQIPFG